MVEQIGACLSLCRDTAIAVIHLQQGIGKEAVARGSPDAKVIYRDVWRINRSTVTHVDDLVARFTAVEHQRGALGVAPVVETAALREGQLVDDIQIGGILQREVVAADLLQPGAPAIDEHAEHTVVVGGTGHRRGRLHLIAKDIAVVKGTALDADLVTADDTFIIIICVAARIVLQRTLASDLSAREDIDLARGTEDRGGGTERHSLRDDHLATAAHHQHVAIRHTLVEAERPGACHIDHHVATDAERRQIARKVIADTEPQAVVAFRFALQGCDLNERACGILAQVWHLHHWHTPALILPASKLLGIHLALWLPTTENHLAASGLRCEGLTDGMALAVEAGSIEQGIVGRTADGDRLRLA